MKRFLLAALAVLCLSSACQPASAELKYEVPDLEMELVMVGALFHETPDPDGAGLVLDLSRYGDRWDRVWGVARNYNVAIHNGRVEAAAVAPDKVQLTLAMKIGDDAWMKGGRGQYEIALQRAADGSLKGDFTGTYKGQAVKGTAYGRIKPTPALAAGYRPIQPGEHPRILFRPHDLPALREKAKTPLGQAALARIGTGEQDAIGMGLQFHITGDKAWADKCAKATAWHMADLSVPAFARGRQWGPRIEQVAVAYDLCCDAWPADFRRQVESYLRFICTQVFFDQRKMGETINWNVGSNYAGPIFAGAAFTGMTLWGEKGPEPAKPAEPAAEADVPPAEGFAAAAGVPVVPLETGKCAAKWLITKPLSFGLASDPMVSVGDLVSLRPAPGTKVTLDGFETAFEPLPAEHMAADGGISLKSGLHTAKALTLLAYTVFEVPGDTLVKVNMPFSNSGRVQMVLNGRCVAHGQVVKLSKGLYPALVVLRLGTVWSTLQPKFDAATEADLAESQKAVAAKTAEYRELLKDWEFDRADWQRLGGADLEYLRIHQMGRRMMVLFCREACGDGGYQTESGHYFNDGLDGPDRYAAAYPKVFGRPLSPFDDIGAVMPRMMFTRVYPATGRSRGQTISSTVTPNGARLPALFPLMRDAWKPVALWYWNRELAGDAGSPDWSKVVEGNAVYSFLHYPLGMKPQAPAPGLPLVWEAPTFGFYAFRNGWAGGDDIVFQVFAKAHSAGGWSGPDAGTFRLMGLGQEWTGGNTSREVRRWGENVVGLPEDTNLTEGSKGKVTHLRKESDGSGAVTIDLSGLCYDKDDKGKPREELYGGVFHAGTSKPLFNWTRAFAVDYSGLSGAPCLMVLVDNITGGKSKEWLWQTGVEGVTVEGNSFTIRRGDASFRGTFVSPDGADIEAAAEGRKTTKSAGHGAGNEMVMKISAVMARGQDPNDGRFFMVGTLQRGEPPKVDVQGRGLDARVKVGRRTVRFDGAKAVIE